ncbi:hypothetical protein [Agaribacter flavus]|uniref:Lipoprotein n=1 Tax=Agaribacter flavus TaxID=1902781 RepID=A0ABV7FUM9_9ALTE
MKILRLIPVLFLFPFCGANACIDLAIENNTKIKISVGFDVEKLRVLASGNLAKFKNPDELPVFIDNEQQFCLYEAKPFLKVVDADKPRQFKVIYGKEVLKPIQCK